MGDHQRRRAFVGAALVLLAVAALVTFREPGPTQRRHAKPPVATTAMRTRRPSASEPLATQMALTVSPPAAARSASPSPTAATRNEREPRTAPAVAPDTATAVARAARTFLVHYLPYSYGRARAERIRAAAGRLVRELERTPPRVPAAVARADPRLVSVHADATLRDLAVNVVAVVDDGQRRYRVPLELRRIHGRWVVTAVGG